MNEQMRIGLIGAGRIGQVHAEVLARRMATAELTMIADVYEPAAAELGKKYKVPYSADYRDILNDNSIDAVAICSSTDTHAQIIVEAAAAGKHIFCEKPIDHNLAKIDTALEAVAQAGVKFMVGFNRRFDPNFRKVRQMVATGKIGEPHILRITSRDPAPPPIDYIKVSGGIFLDMTIHDFDMARFVMGSEVVELFVQGAVLVDPAIGEAGDIDTAVISLKFANGAVGTIDNSRQAVYGYDQRVEVFGSEGMVQAGNETPTTTVYSHANAIESEKPLYFFLQRYMDAYVEEMRQFVACLVEDTEPTVTGIDGRIPVIMGLAAIKSLQENRPVKLSEVAG